MQSLASQNPEQFDLYFKINDLGSDCPSNIDVCIIDIAHILKSKKHAVTVSSIVWKDKRRGKALEVNASQDYAERIIYHSLIIPWGYFT